MNYADAQRVWNDLKKWRKTDEGQQWYAETLDIQDNRCYYCAMDLTGRRTNVDHAIPVFKSGTNDPHNLVISCAYCNERKRNDIWERWRSPDIIELESGRAWVEMIHDPGYIKINFRNSTSGGWEYFSLTARDDEQELDAFIDILQRSSARMKRLGKDQP